MKRLPSLLFILVVLGSMLVTGCGDDSTWDQYEEWRKTNDNFYLSQLDVKNPDGTPFYTQLKPSWYPTSGVLIHYFNDRSKTAGNLSPMVNSTVDVKYIGRLYNNEPFDSSFTATTYGDSIFRTKPSGTISGWQIALTDMRVGDSARVVIPYGQGYEAQSTGSIPPYSTLIFDIKLVDIYRYELND